MIKVCTLIKRRQGLSREDFADWWLKRHAPRACKLEGLKRYQISLALGEDESAYDGMAELWFDSVEELRQAFATDLGRALAADSQAQASERVRIVVKENLILGG